MILDKFEAVLKSCFEKSTFLKIGNLQNLSGTTAETKSKPTQQHSCSNGFKELEDQPTFNCGVIQEPHATQSFINASGSGPFANKEINTGAEDRNPASPSVECLYIDMTGIDQ